jgi:hypothetical protein
MQDPARTHSLLDHAEGQIRGARWLDLAGLTRILLILTVCQLLLQLNSSFWLDETLSYWATNGGFSQILARCTAWPSSFLYSVLFFSLRPMGAAGPWIYRLPSLVAIALSALWLFRIAQRLFGSQAAWIAVAAFISLHPVQFAACDARPYALGLLAVLLSTDLLLLYLDRPSFAKAGLYAVVTALVPYFHLLFGAALLFQLLYVVYCYFDGLRIQVRHAVFSIATMVVLVLPLANQFLASSRSAPAHSFTDRPRPNNFVEMYFSVDLALALLLAFGAAALLAPKLQWSWPRKPASNKILVVLWALTAPLLLYVVSTFSEAHVFVPRYFLPYAPGLALCVAIVVTSFDRHIVALAFLTGLIAMAALPLRHPTSIRHTVNLGDWGAAVAFLNAQAAIDDVPVLMRSQYPESNFLPLTPVEDNPNFSQLSYYATRARVIPLPASFGGQLRSLVDDLLRTTLRSTTRFLFVSYNGPPGLPQPFIAYLQGKLGPSWKVRNLREFDGVVITEFALQP